MSINFDKTLGYGGGAKVDNVDVLLTGGSIEGSTAVSFIEAYDINPTLSAGPRSKIKHADGTKAYSLTLAFDVTNLFVNQVCTTTRIFKRNYSFPIIIRDGEFGYTASNCYATNFTLAGAVGGLVSANLSVVSLKAETPREGVGPDMRVFATDTNILKQPLGYWYSGNTDVKDWSFTYTQATTPAYGNEDTQEPMYIKCGLVEYTLACTTYSALQHDSITIRTNEFTIVGVTSSQGYSYGGLSDLGVHTHSFVSAASASTGSNEVVLT